MDEAMIDFTDVKEEVMRKKKSEAPPEADREECDPAIAVYELKPIEEIRAELHAFGIDPGPTIAAVKALIIDALRRRGDRGWDHLKALLELFSAISWTTVPFASRP
jgi:hypothetical protein